MAGREFDAGVSLKAHVAIARVTWLVIRAHGPSKAYGLFSRAMRSVEGPCGFLTSHITVSHRLLYMKDVYLDPARLPRPS